MTLILLFIHSPITNTPLGPNTFLSILLSKTHNPSSCLNMRDQVPTRTQFLMRKFKN